MFRILKEACKTKLTPYTIQPPYEGNLLDIYAYMQKMPIGNHTLKVLQQDILVATVPIWQYLEF